MYKKLQCGIDCDGLDYIVLTILVNGLSGRHLSKWRIYEYHLWSSVNCFTSLSTRLPNIINIIAQSDVTFVLTTAILKMAEVKTGEFQNKYLKFLSPKTYNHTPQLSKNERSKYGGNFLNGR